MEPHIGYKQANGCIIKLSIIGKNNEDRKGIVNKNYAKFQTSEVVIISITDLKNKAITYKKVVIISDHGDVLVYRVGETACENGGIYYFLTEEPARHYFLYEGFRGVHRLWHPDGSLMCEALYERGKINGIATSWYASGKIRSKEEYVNGKLHGAWEDWSESGKKTRVTVYDNDEAVKTIDFSELEESQV